MFQWPCALAGHPGQCFHVSSEFPQWHSAPAAHSSDSINSSPSIGHRPPLLFPGPYWHFLGSINKHILCQDPNRVSHRGRGCSWLTQQPSHPFLTAMTHRKGNHRNTFSRLLCRQGWPVVCGQMSSGGVSGEKSVNGLTPLGGCSLLSLLSSLGCGSWSSSSHRAGVRS